MKTKKRIWLYVVCCLLALIVLVCGIVLYQNWNSVEALIDSFRYSQEDITQQETDTKEKLEQVLIDNSVTPPRDLTAEELAALNSGQLTEEEAVKLMTGQTATPAPSTPTPVKTQAPQKPNPPVTNPVQTEAPTPEPTIPPKTSAQIISEAVARLYVQKNVFLNKLDEVEAHVINLYDNVMTPEQKLTAKKDLLAIHLPEVAAWEKDCDAKVYAIIAEIRAELKKSGQPQTMADEIEQAYLNEKRLKKSYFINRYMD